MKGGVYPSVIMCYSIADIILSVLVASFGRYVKFNVRKGSTQQLLSLGQLNTFQAFKLMTSQARLGTQTFPPSVATSSSQQEE